MQAMAKDLFGRKTKNYTFLSSTMADSLYLKISTLFWSWCCAEGNKEGWGSDHEARLWAHLAEYL